MPTFAFQCDEQQRPILTIEVRSPIEGIETSDRVLAWIDTGADTTVISEDKIEGLQLDPLGTTRIQLADGRSLACMQYLANIRLVIPNSKNTYDIGKFIIIGIPRGHDVPCLIGLNLLSKAMFAYDGRESQFSLIFPD